MMVRILSLLPMLVGLLCALILLLSLFGYQTPETGILAIGNHIRGRVERA